MIALVFLFLAGGALAQSATECADYCTQIGQICTGSLAQFPTPDSFYFCLNDCMLYPNNATLNTSGDSFQCRWYHLSVANTSTSNANTHCPHAGFNGGPNVCGSFCEAYCDNIMAACTSANGNQIFADRAKCMQECSYYPRDSAFNLSSTAVAGGNSVDCRAWHSQVAFNQTGGGITAHCGHASPQGGQFCGTDCQNYCDNVMAVCQQDDLKQWTSMDQCLLACSSFPMQNFTNTTFTTNQVTGGNSLPCRKYHASVAGSSTDAASVHCIHTGPLGGSGTCGAAGEGLCNILIRACPSKFFPTNCTTVVSSLTASTVNTTDILNGKVPQGSIGCATYYGLKALADNSMCSKVESAVAMASSTTECTGAAALVKASWTVIAVVLLALGFSS